MAPSTTGKRPRLTRDDWVRGAFRLGIEVGFDRLAVEPLAAAMGATKGSFYWHFADRNALIEALLDAWERDATQGVIAAVDAYPTPERLPRLLRTTFDAGENERLESALFAAADEQIIERTRATHEIRIAYTAGLLRDLGLPDDQASARARMIYAAFLGHLQLLRGPRLPEAGHAAMLEELIATAVPPPGGGC